jgi:riboflavin kinase/FMN adenylyltransferase
MKIYQDINNLPVFKNAVLTIGSFDGVHIGHQQIIKQINDLAKSINGESVVITFHPHPRLALNPNNSTLKLLNTLSEKANLLAQYGINHLVVVPFSLEFASQEPSTYIKEFLIAKFQPKIIAIGYDHKFGKNRAGNITYLKEFESEHDFKVVEISKQEVANIAVSSTKVRQAVEEGNVSKAAKLLGHYPILSGRVVKGLQIGAKIGYPTANIEIEDKHKLIPPEGIYAVLVKYATQTYQGMLCIGTRPTIGGDLRQTIEVNIFDFEQSIYDENLEVFFVEYLRANNKFEGLEELKAQLTKDKISAAHVLNPTL